MHEVRTLNYDEVDQVLEIESSIWNNCEDVVPTLKTFGVDFEKNLDKKKEDIGG